MKKCVKKFVILCGLFFGSKNSCLVDQLVEEKIAQQNVNASQSQDVSLEELKAAYARITKLNAEGIESLFEIYGESENPFEACRKDAELFGLSGEAVSWQNASKNEILKSIVRTCKKVYEGKNSSQNHGMAIFMNLDGGLNSKRIAMVAPLKDQSGDSLEEQTVKI